MPRNVCLIEGANAINITVGAHGHRKREPLKGGVSDFRAVHFLIEEVAPPPHRLRDEDVEDNAVGNAQKVDLLDEADDKPCKNAAHDAAEDAQAPASDAVPLEPLGNMHTVRDAVVKARADERRGNADDKQR